MLGKINRSLRVYRWLQALEQRSGIVDLPTKSDYKSPKVLTGTVLARMNLAQAPQELRNVEFQVFSQFGDDGIIQYLVHSLQIKERTFVEFGVEDYTEAENIEHINRDLISLFYDVRPTQAFITAENINDLIQDAGLAGKIGLLSIDIDGVDYWVWQAITVVDPAIVVAEYNATFGSDRAITVPYNADFTRGAAHPSRLYWGASLKALQIMGTEKGYTFIGCNANGNNAYFVRNEYALHPAVVNLERRFYPATFAEHSINGRRVRYAEVYETIRGLPVFNIQSGQIEPL
jgi:hypothetical protein